MFNIASPRTDDAAIEQEIKAKGLTAPRVTPADIEDVISSEHYFTGEDGVVGAMYNQKPSTSKYNLKPNGFPDVGPQDPMRLLTFCVLVLKNGFTVTGESACASPENFDPEIGKKIARENAKNKLWPLLGYALKNKLANLH